MIVRTSLEPLPSPARGADRNPRLLRVAAIQERWYPDADEHKARLRDAALAAAEHAPALICMQELTLSPYFPQSRPDPGAPVDPESLDDGATVTFARALARDTNAHVHASLFEKAEGGADERANAAAHERGYNTAIVVAPGGDLVARTRKIHIPLTHGYHEDLYFESGAAGEDPFPVVSLAEARLGFPTCYDQWFPEVARGYGLRDADVVVYATAIGSEVNHPHFDSEPMWEQVMIGGGIANGLFVVAANRIGTENGTTFFGSSFISDPYGRKLVQAPRDEPAVIVAELDLNQRADWLELFPFFRARRPAAYRALTDPQS